MKGTKKGKATRRVALAAAFALMPVESLIAGGSSVGVFEPELPVTTVFPQNLGPVQAAPVPLQTASPAGTAYVTESIEDAYALCSSLQQREYSVDCLRSRIQELADTMPDTGEYSEAKAVLEDTAQKLDTVVRQTRSISKPRARVQATVRGTPVVTPPLRAVREESVQEALVEATDILDEAATRLLRSAEGSQARKVAYQDIAVAVGTNKILLRSG